ncbi:MULTISPECIES: iron-containing alcohol dehydrogenase [Spongiibacter]|uniref:iron-containing alcohol dehydrogenase n=1 Tax=Spongiibacter TaxID=630749 RepID=UPI001B0BAF32|nr:MULTISPECIES: iron-containing alcohol dehydrogenase [Spongiibacter]MBO6752661.1 iron-containing alcohol dehydrogenase [Spongiibacter sp.]|tara:strand:+ start:14471 stop:15619 length:1149 start_codon:yes stop_codon:yes gene_type:complete
MKFSFVNPTQIHFGQGQIARIASAIPRDARVLLLYGGGSIKRNGVYEQAVAALEGFTWQEFAGVEPNPTVETLNRAVEQVKAEGLSYILAVGGGSVIDGAKYVAAAACYDGDGWDILLGKHRVAEALPIGAVLTLPATGSESNGGSVVTKAATQEKLNFVSPLVQPHFAVLDPDVMKTLPERQLANGLVDAWVHTCEQYLTMPTEAMVQEGYAEVLLRSLKTLGEQFAQRDSDAWRANLMLAANQALNGFIGSGVPQDWATHMIGHELTALYGVDHGRSLAIVQPSLLRHQIEYKRAKLEQMARNVFGLSDGDALAERCVDAIEAFYHSLGVATQLTEHDGDKAAAIDTIVARLESHSMVKLGERRAITPAESREILQQAVA